MLFQSLKEILLICLVISIIGGGLYLYINSNIYALKPSLLAKYFTAKIYDSLGSSNLIEFEEFRGQILAVPSNQYLAWYQIKILPKLLLILKSSLIVGVESFLASFLLISIIFYYKGREGAKSQYLRGIKLIEPSELEQQITTYNTKHQYSNPYKIGNLPYPKGTEYQHTIITGATGSGKTQMILNLLDQIRERGDRALIYDRTGTYIRKLYQPKKDIILNPFDQRSADWNIFREAREKSDFDLIAASLIEESTANNNDPFWNKAARIVLSESCALIAQEKNPTNQRLCQILLKLKLHKLSEYLKDTPAGSIMDTSVDKNSTALSVRMILSTYANCLKLIYNNSNNIDNCFSIRDWIQDNNSKSFLFLSSSATKYDSVKSLLSLWVDIAVRELLNMNQDDKRTIWFIIDEFPSLQKLSSLKMALAESRQYGGAIVLAMQAISQMQEVYGSYGAESISGSCRNRITLATSDKGTARWCAENLGNKEILTSRENVSFGADSNRDGVSISSNKEIESLVLPAEIMKLESLEFYAKFSGEFDITKSKIEYKERPDIAEKFIMKEEIGEGEELTQEQETPLKSEVKIKQRSKKADKFAVKRQIDNHQLNDQEFIDRNFDNSTTSEQDFQEQLTKNGLELIEENDQEDNQGLNYNESGSTSKAIKDPSTDFF